VVARIARAGGLFLGTELNRYLDALDIAAYLDRWVNAYIAEGMADISLATRSRMARDLRLLAEAHRAPMSAEWRAWGWKAPRSIFLLPLFDVTFPRSRFLHVVRDGRDMALSANQNQLWRHGRALLGPEAAQLSPPLQSIALWNRVNLLAADYGERAMGERYLRLRFEDLCREPAAAIQRLFAFFALEGDVAGIAEGLVHPPDSLGRWRGQDARLVAELTRIGGDGLRWFGYG
jgi:hypothetical protein